MHDDDREALRKAMRGVRPLPSRAAPAAVSRPPPRAGVKSAPAPAASARRPPGAVVPATAPGDELRFRRPGVGESEWRRLRRGQFPADAELDLHGLRQAQAQARLDAFFADARRHDVNCVRIVHGKGYRSGGDGPVLKPFVDYWLRHCAEVAAFVSARPAQGGTGAVYVLLASRRRS